MNFPKYNNRIYTLNNGSSLEIGKRTLIMGILNATPDSFSDGGRFNSQQSALKRAQEMIYEGVDIIDVGGESTRPGSEPVSELDELNRVIPIIEIVSQLGVPISIDTYKSKVAIKAIESGASIINDIWGFQKDPDISMVAASFQVPSILMHNSLSIDYKHNIIDELKFFFEKSIEIGIKAGLDEKYIILDPGIGFSKTFEHNLEIMRRLDEITSLGYPVLLGASRKTFIGKILDQNPPNRLEGTLAVKTMGIMLGCDIIRVHDIIENKRIALMSDAIFRR
jgi:dihydropteroate synthase